MSVDLTVVKTIPGNTSRLERIEKLKGYDRSALSEGLIEEFMEPSGAILVHFPAEWYFGGSDPDDGCGAPGVSDPLELHVTLKDEEGMAAVRRIYHMGDMMRESASMFATRDGLDCVGIEWARDLIEALRELIRDIEEYDPRLTAHRVKCIGWPAKPMPEPTP